MLHGLLYHIQADRIEGVAITTIKSHKMLVIAIEAEDSVLVNFVGSCIDGGFDSLAGDKLHGGEFPVRVVVSNSEPDTFYFIRSWDLVFVVEFSSSNCW